MNRPTATSAFYFWAIFLSSVVLLSPYASPEQKGLAALAWLILVPMALLKSGKLGGAKDRINGRNGIRSGAGISAIKPEFRDVGTPHFDVTVEFDDGSWFITDLEGRSRRYRSLGGWGPRKVEVSYSEWELRAAVERAVRQHEMVARRLGR